jgi:hypothetical protein
MKVVIFLGPSLPLKEAQSVLEAVYLPPASQADLLSALHLHQPQVIGLIDGVFGQSLSVWHKEILYALKRGVRVYGASSMGALRAAETADFGMLGVGEIYSMFRDGRLRDDDEVALLHGPQDYDYRPLTLPMVNVRATLQKALQKGLLDAEACRQLTSVAKSLFYGQRTRSALVKAWADCEGGGAMARFLESDYVDLKRQDALELLTTIAHLPGLPEPPAASFEMQASPLFEALQCLDRRVSDGLGEVSLETVALTSALHHPCFSEVRFQALNRSLVVLMAEHFGVTVTPAEIEKEESRFRLRRQLEDPEDFQRWLHDNHLEAREMQSLMSQLALCRAMQRWLGARTFLEKSTRTYLDELRLRGEFPEAVKQAVELGRANRPLEGRPSLEDLFLEHLLHSDCQPDTQLSEWMQEAGFRSKEELHHHLFLAQSIWSRQGWLGAANEWA